LVLLSVIGMVIGALSYFQPPPALTTDRAWRARQAILATEPEDTSPAGNLLGPIGRKPGGPSRAEAEPLLRLGNLTDEGARRQFLEELIHTPGVAERVQRRVGWLVQAVVGLDRSRREQATKIVLKGLGETGPPEAQWVCALLGIELDISAPSFLEAAAKATVAAMERSKSAVTLHSLAETLMGLVPRLPAEQAAAGRRQAAVALVAAVEKADSATDLKELALGLSLVFDGQAGPEAVQEAGRAAEALVAAMQSTSEAYQLIFLCKGLVAVLPHLRPEQAATVAEQAAAVLVLALTRTTNINIVGPLGSAVSEVIAWAPGAAVDRLARPLVEAMGPTVHPIVLGAEAQVLAAIAARVGADRAAPHVEPALELLLDLRRNRPEGLAAINLSGAIGSLVPYIRPEAMATVLDQLMALLQRAGNWDGSSALAVGLRSILVRLSPAEAARVAEDLLPNTEGRNRRGSTLKLAAYGLAILADRRPPAVAAEHATKVARAMVDRVWRGNAPVSLENIATGLSFVAERLPEGQAAEHAGSIAAAIRGTLRTSTDDNVLRSLSRALRALAPWLNQAAATESAEELVAVMSRNDDVLTLAELGTAFEAVATHASPSQSPTLADKAVRRLLTSMGKNTHPMALSYFALGVAAVARHLPPGEAAGQAGVAVEHLVTSLALDLDSTPLQALVEGLAAVAPRMSATAPRKVGGLLISNMARNSFLPGPPVLADALRDWAARQTTDELVAALAHPLAAGTAQRALLDELGRRTHHRFRNTWHFLDWAAANGLDLVPPLVNGQRGE
jgi:hypothetical protein